MLSHKATRKCCSPAVVLTNTFQPVIKFSSITRGKLQLKVDYYFILSIRNHQYDIFYFKKCH